MHAPRFRVHRADHVHFPEAAVQMQYPRVGVTRVSDLNDDETTGRPEETAKLRLDTRFACGTHPRVDCDENREMEIFSINFHGREGATWTPHINGRVNNTNARARTPSRCVHHFLSTFLRRKTSLCLMNRQVDSRGTGTQKRQTGSAGPHQRSRDREPFKTSQ